MAWHDLKQAVVVLTGLDKDGLHIVGGMMIYLILFYLLRTRAHALMSWFILLLLELGNEALDFVGAYRIGSKWEMPEQIVDVLITMFIPTLFQLNVLIKSAYSEECQPEMAELFIARRLKF